MNHLKLAQFCDLPEDFKLIPATPYKVKSLTWQILISENVTKLVELLNLFKDSLEILRIDRKASLPQPNLIGEAILSNFTKLRYLHLNFNMLPVNEHFYRTTERLECIKSLKFNAEELNPVAVRGIAKLCPNIELVQAEIRKHGDNLTADDFAFFVEKLKKLRWFSISVLDETIINKGYFRNLTFLTISKISNPIDFAHVSKYSPNVEVFAAWELARGTFDFKLLISSFKNLKTLIIGEGFKVTMNNINQIKKSTSLKKFVVLEKTLKKSLKFDNVAKILKNSGIELILSYDLESYTVTHP